MTAYEELASRFGTPLYVYDADVARASLDRLRAALPAPAAVLYSVKANPHPDLIRALRLGGAGAEISSTGELAAALAAGHAGADCLYTGPAKTAAEIGAALDAGIRRFSVESAADYGRVRAAAAARAVVAECLVRVNPPAAAAGGVRMAAGPGQFGVDVADLLADPGAFAAGAGGHVTGLHFFPLSNAFDAAGLLRQLTATVEVAGKLRATLDTALSTVDLGGGFAAPYAAPGPTVDYTGLRAPVAAALDRHLPGWRERDPAIAFESGRHLVGPCGALVCRVVEVKRSRGRTYVLLESGINHLGGMSGLGRMLPMTAEPLRPDRPGAGRAALVGPLCTPVDVLNRDAPGGAAAGDLVVIPNTGAYGLTASLIGFLGRPAPVEVVVSGGRVASATRLDLVRSEYPAGASRADR